MLLLTDKHLSQNVKGVMKLSRKRRNANDQLKAWMDGISKMDVSIGHKQSYDDEATYEKVHKVYSMMKDLLIEMNNCGDLKGYYTEDIFKLIRELEQDD